MPRNATTGVYTRPSNTFSDPVTSTVIDPGDATTFFDDQDTEGFNKLPGELVTDPSGTAFVSLVGQVGTLGNVVGGTTAGASLSTSPNNVIIGNLAGSAMSTGTGENVAIGIDAMAAATTATQCTVVGAEAGMTMTSDTGHTLYGYQAGRSLNGAAQTWNTFIGHISGRFVTSGGSNVAVGRATMASDTDGSYNTVMGHAAYFVGLHSVGIIAIGDAAAGANVDGTSTNWQGSGLTYWGSINDVSSAYLGRFSGKSSAAARTNATAIGNLARMPLKDNTIVLGHGITAVETAGNYWDGWTRVDITSTVGLTVTAAQLLTGLVVRGGVLAGPVNDTLPTAANIVASGPGLNCEVPCSVERSYGNNTSGGFTVTLIAPDASVTVSGLGLGGAVATNVLAKFRIVITNATAGAEAVVIYRVA